MADLGPVPPPADDLEALAEWARLGWIYQADPRDLAVRIQALAAALSKIPDTLRWWFEGRSVLADRFGLPRFEMRFRVVDAIANLGDEEEPWIVRPSHSPIREFKTHKAAKRLADRWASEGRVAILQYAPVVWLTNDELPKDEAADAATVTPAALGG